VEEFKLSTSKFSRNKTIKVFKPSQDESPSPRRYTAQAKPSLVKPVAKVDEKQKSPKRSEKQQGISEELPEFANSEAEAFSEPQHI